MTVCDAGMAWRNPLGDDIIIACTQTAAHHGLHANGVTTVTWQEQDRRTYHGEFPGWCQRTAGCLLPQGHGGRCAT